MLISIVSFFLLSCTNSNGRESSFSWQIAEGSRIIVKLSRHPYSEALISRLTEFEELTGIDVEYTVAREDLYYEDLDKSMSARRTRPDVFMTGAYHIWGYASRGIVENLDSYIQSSSLTDVRYDSTDFYDGIITSLRWEPGNEELGTGPLLALPMGFELNTLAYNKRIFDELGLEAPETYDELLELCSVLKEYNGPGSYPIALRGTRDWSSIHSAYMTAYTAFGAEDFKLNDQGILEPAIDSPESLAMNRYWMELVRKGATPSRATQNWYEVGFALGDGRSAMMFDADIVAYFQNIPGYSKEAGNIAWAPPPVVNRGDVRKSNMWIWSLAMHSEARNKTAAWLFIQYFTSRGVPVVGGPGAEQR